jgi:hypothetical protein
VRVHVRLARTVAAFATYIFGVLFAGSNALEMRVFIKIEPDVRVTRPANVAANELVFWVDLLCLLCARDATKYSK